MCTSCTARTSPVRRARRCKTLLLHGSHSFDQSVVENIGKNAAHCMCLYIPKEARQTYVGTRVVQRNVRGNGEVTEEDQSVCGFSDKGLQRPALCVLWKPLTVSNDGRSSTVLDFADNAA